MQVSSGYNLSGCKQIIQGWQDVLGKRAPKAFAYLHMSAIAGHVCSFG